MSSRTKIDVYKTFEKKSYTVLTTHKLITYGHKIQYNTLLILLQ